MGCGSSAAALVAGVALASHFGGLNWTPKQILSEASQREGHPDNVAACVLGGPYGLVHARFQHWSHNHRCAFHQTAGVLASFVSNARGIAFDQQSTRNVA